VNKAATGDCKLYFDQATPYLHKEEPPTMFIFVSRMTNLRCPKGNAAEAVAMRLDKKIRENLRDARNSLFANDSLQVD